MQTVIEQPYTNQGLNRIYDLLFCDDPELFRPAKSEEIGYPMNTLFSDKATAEDLRQLIADEQVETRIKILAYHKLASPGKQDEKKELLGVIIEVGLENGLDVLAAYRDGTARYINHSGKMVIWDSPDNKSRLLIEGLFSEGRRVVKNIGPWNGRRLAPPSNGDVRLSFLVSNQLYFGQGPFDVLVKDAMGGPVIHAATELMIFLTEKA